jgi:predicted DNA-binding transcriptional regulator AlpA
MADPQEQLPLAIEAPASIPSPTQVASTGVGAPPPRFERSIDLEHILWMRDVVALTATHRSTIHRWIRDGLFPAKDAPRGDPRGWLHSTIKRWQQGDTPHSAAIVRRRVVQPAKEGGN